VLDEVRNAQRADPECRALIDVACAEATPRLRLEPMLGRASPSAGSSPARRS